MDRYEEALEKARVEYEKAREQGYTWLMDLLEGMFPEVKESDDERIRKWIIAEIKATHDYDSPTSAKCVDDALAWLKSLRPPQYCENCKLKRSVENWKPSKEQMGMLLAVINDPNNAGAESCHLMLQSLFADLQKLL